MMGERTVVQEALFYSFNLERYALAISLLRSIDLFVDLSGIREHCRISGTLAGPELFARKGTDGANLAYGRPLVTPVTRAWHDPISVILSIKLPRLSTKRRGIIGV
ncbi:MAG: hypothetical protein Q8J79_08070 [Erythrobacter sp.]|nr:hypothetical protein [Erythrobacter sp.]